MTLVDLLEKGHQLVNNNSTTILSGIGVTGSITTAVLTGRASFRAARIIDSEVAERKARSGNVPGEENLDNKDKFKLVWHLYIPPVGVGAITVTSIIAANRVSSKQAAALAAAYSVSEKAFTEYRERVVEKFGEGKETAVHDAFVKNRVENNPVNSREVIIAGTGEVLCMDIMSGRYFQSSVEEIKKAENETNFEIVNHMYASLSSFYDRIGLPATGFSDVLGFNVDNRCEVKFSAQLSSDGRPCVAIDFHHPPVAEYAKFY